MPPKPWKTLSSRRVYENPWMKVREDIAEMPNGRTTVYGVCEFGECVGVLPFVDDEHVALVRQYRYVQGENQRWEMPTGGVHAGELPLKAAERELREEAGYRAGELTLLHTYYTSKSICQETAYLYIGRNLQYVGVSPDETEFMEIEVFTFREALEMVKASEIRDSMTVIAVLMAALAKS